MKDKYKFALVLALTLLLITAATVLAISEEDPTTTWNVTPQDRPFPSGRECLNEGTFLIQDAFTGAGSPGTYTETHMAGGYPVTVEIVVHSDLSFDFNITGGVVFEFFVKGGLGGTSGYRLYQYVPTWGDATNDGPVTYDTGLHDGINTDGKYQAISHIDMCVVPMGDPLRAIKTAYGSYEENHTWTVQKSVDPEDQWGWAGDFLDWVWLVEVSETYEEENFNVWGEITIWNDNPYPVEVDVTDILNDGTPMTVVCPASAVPAAVGVIPGELVCTYSGAPDGRTATLNTATIESLDYRVEGTTAEADVAFDVTVGNGTAYIDDDQELDFPLTLVAGEGPWSWTETYDYTCSLADEAYEAGSYTGNEDNTVVLTPSDGDPQSASASTVYTCYMPAVSKTAAGTYDEHHEWDIEKSVDPESQSGFMGDYLDWTWTVTVSQTKTEEEFDVSGMISVVNPNPHSVLPVILTDLLGDGTPATIDLDYCTNSEYVSGKLFVYAGMTSVCDYAVFDLPYSDVGDVPTSNTVTADFDNGTSQSAAVDFGWTVTVYDGSAVVDDDQDLELPETVYAGEGSWTWTETYYHTCSSDLADYGENGMYEVTIDNLATVTGSHGDYDEASASTIYTCYAPSIEKDAEGTYDETHTWELTKGVNPLDQTGIAGDTLPWTWVIEISESYTESNFAVTGNITVHNPADLVLTVDLIDQLGTGEYAEITGCTGGDFTAPSTLTVPAAGTAVCAYSADLSYDALVNAPRSNTATITLNDIDIFDTKPVNWTPNVINGSAVFTDPHLFEGEILLNAGEGPWESWTFDDEHICSTLAGDYTDGEYTGGDSNTAYLLPSDGEQMSDSASTAYTCYAPILDKDALGSYDETHEWEIFKNVDPLYQSGYPGDLLDWEWTVEVTETVGESNFDVIGQITVENPSPDDGMVVTLFDYLSDGTIADITGCEGLDVVFAEPNILAIPAATTAICHYTALDLVGILEVAMAPDENNAELTMTASTVGVGPYMDSVTVTIPWSANVIDPAVDLVDANYPIFDYPGLDHSNTQSLVENHICSSSRSAYLDGGSYGTTLYNLAELYIGERWIDGDDATTEYLCEASFVDVLKLTNGQAREDKEWSFVLSKGGSHLETQTTPPTLLQFQTALRPGDIYTMCELNIPAGWEAMWSFNGTPLYFVGGPGDLIGDGTNQVYDPEWTDPEAEHSTRCVNFHAPMVASDTLAITVDNVYDEGDTRTPGYWKNWNTCSGGNQQYTAAKNGGAAEGFFLLDDLIPQYVGDLLIGTCEVGVNILNKSTLDGEKKASDPAFNLATALLAAKLNVAAGAGTPQVVHDAIAEADNILAGIGFDGYAGTEGKKGEWFPKKSPERTRALELQELLDDYNNGYYYFFP